MAFALQESNAPGVAIVILLFAGSIGAWSIMITKGVALSQAQKQSRHMLSLFRSEKDPVALLIKRRQFPASPLFKVYESGCLAIGGELDFTGSQDTSELFASRLDDGRLHLSSLQLETVRNAAERAVSDQAMLMEDQMGLLATAVSASPFLGLLGTVWGVMDAFGGMAVSGSAMLSAVAPGISGALLTTVVGLFVAIPSAVGYNLLTHKIRKLTVQMDNFAQEFVAEVQRNYLVK